ncbi:hypothetical protein A2765_02255 [Candidatus Kaiserbacteria bacterium RIFCSPHIGHO2_01_FULL_56_24]|uniref:LysM domain-containing protein n=1 Tax=Candidatus Kaiserbacteria bacterium RIFCSPHIGHO2_01_FULL_56_24 TaxID=1798487 RepID=A0A1F6DB27_9BACT|nr:MAG: hypothetical protein A2765_02255 [Candidatus Kaiserbacteria bacterium RIFCSPHIGHO2_01_FULL_56_24]
MSAVVGAFATTAIGVGALAGLLFPSPAAALTFGDLQAFFRPKAEASVSQNHSPSVQSMPILEASVSPNPAKGGGDVTIVDGVAVVPDEGPSGTIADIEKPKSSSISIYVVRPADTLSSIAHMFGVSVNTVRWANDIPVKGTIRVGQTLTILPIDGVPYTVKKGDTIASIAKKFGGDATEITNYNSIEGDLAVGTEIIIPNGEIVAPPTPAVAKKPAARSGGASAVLEAASYSTSAEYAGYYIAPLTHYKETQGIHGYNGVDLASLDGKTAPILASASGDVIVAKQGGWNGGYGSYIVIQHPNGTQTLYSHASSVIVGAGQHVVQGQVIGYQGQTGKATGPHVHFEIRGGPRNPF